MTTKTRTPSLEDRQRAAAEAAELLTRELVQRQQERKEAETAARIAAAQSFVDTELPKLSEELAQAEAHLESQATGEVLSIESLWSAFVTVRTLARTRAARHNVANGTLDSLSPRPQNHIGADMPRHTVDDTWAPTPWSVLIERVLERRLDQASSAATAQQWVVIDGAATEAGKRMED